MMQHVCGKLLEAGSSVEQMSSNSSNSSSMFVSLQLPPGPTFSLVDMEAHLLWYDGPGLVMRVMSTVHGVSSTEENINIQSQCESS